MPYTDGGDVFLHVLKHPILSRSFQRYCVENFSSENFFGYRRVVRFRTIDPSEEHANKIRTEFLDKDSVLEVDIPGRVRAGIEEAFVTGNIYRDMFLNMEEFIYQVMRQDTFTSWKKSNEAQKALEKARLPNLRWLLMSGRRASLVTATAMPAEPSELRREESDLAAERKRREEQIAQKV